MVKTGKLALLAGVLGAVAPIVLTIAVAAGLEYGWNESIFLGLVLSATSVSISAQTRMELRVLRNREGITMLGAPVVEDALSLLLLSVFVALIVTSGVGALGVMGIIVRMLLLLGLALVVALRLLPRLPVRLSRLPISEPVISGTIVMMLTFAWGAEELGGWRPSPAPSWLAWVCRAAHTLIPSGGARTCWPMPSLSRSSWLRSACGLMWAT